MAEVVIALVAAAILYDYVPAQRSSTREGVFAFIIAFLFVFVSIFGLNLIQAPLRLALDAADAEIRSLTPTPDEILRRAAESGKRYAGEILAFYVERALSAPSPFLPFPTDHEGATDLGVSVEEYRAEFDALNDRWHRTVGRPRETVHMQYREAYELETGHEFVTRFGARLDLVIEQLRQYGYSSDILDSHALFPRERRGRELAGELLRQSERALHDLGGA